MPTLTINDQVIDFPNSTDSPDWSPAIVQFAQAVTDALAISVNTGDVFPQFFPLDIYNSASNINVPALFFSTNSVRAVFIRYSVFRSTDSASVYEAGDMIAIYNSDNIIGSKWAFSQGNIIGDGAQISFNLTDTGQLQFSTTPLSGINHTGKFSFEARVSAQ